MTFDPIEERDATIAELRAEVRAWEDWSNRLAENIPDHYDGDDAQEAIIEKYVADLATEVKRLRDELDRERLSQDYKPEGVDVVMGKVQDARRRAEAAESALRQVRQALTALADEYAANGAAREVAGKPAWPNNVARDLRAVLDSARAGASDPQPDPWCSGCDPAAPAANGQCPAHDSHRESECRPETCGGTTYDPCAAALARVGAADTQPEAPAFRPDADLVSTVEGDWKAVARVKAQCAEWERLYREAVGQPATEHQQRRMEQVANQWESAETKYSSLRKGLEIVVDRWEGFKSPTMRTVAVTSRLRALLADTQPEGAGDDLPAHAHAGYGPHGTILCYCGETFPHFKALNEHTGVKTALWRAAPSPAEGISEAVHWVGDAPTSLHGNGAASFTATSRHWQSVTCTLCLSLRDRAEGWPDPATPSTEGGE